MALMMTLLLVVGCDVSPVANNNLIRASVNISDSRDLQVVGGDGNITSYKIAMIPEWSETSIDEQIVGKKGSRDENGNITSWEAVSYSKENGNVAIDLGYISQGKWSIYINAYNEANDLIYVGNTMVYLNLNQTDVVVLLRRTGLDSDVGRLGFNITLNRLNLTDSYTSDENGIVDESGNVYRLMYKVLGGKEPIQGYIPLASMFGAYSVFGDFKNPVHLIPGDYTVVVSLVKKDSEGKETIIGGITRLVSVFPSKTDNYDDWTKLVGEVTPSDFIQVGIDFPAPDIKASISCLEVDGVYTFSCEDKYNITNGYKRYFRWFIDGELVEGNNNQKWTVDDVSLSGNKSSLTCSFLKKGEREVHCEVVYVPSSVADIDNQPLHFIGGDTFSVQVLSISQ